MAVTSDGGTLCVVGKDEDSNDGLLQIVDISPDEPLGSGEPDGVDLEGGSWASPWIRKARAPT